MRSTTPETSRRRLPRLQCGLCGKTADALDLGRWGRYRICPDCHDNQIAAPLADRDNGDTDQTLLIRRVDAAFRVGAVVCRLLLYFGLYQLARRTDFGPHVLTGFLLADTMTWIASAWLEKRFHSLAVTLEAILYTGALALWILLTGGLEFPDDPTAMGIVALSFLGTFSTKGCWQAYRILHGDRRRDV